MKKFWKGLISVTIASTMLITGCSVPTPNNIDAGQNTNNLTAVSSTRTDVFRAKTVNVSIEKSDIYGDNVQIASSFSEFTAKTADLARKSESITVNSLSPQLVSLFDDSKAQSAPMALSVIANPSRAQTVLISPQSTAEALVFMNPALATVELDEADKVMNIIKKRPETASLASLIERKVQQDPNFLNKEDSQLTSAVAKVVEAVTDVLADEFDRTAAKAAEPENRVNGVEIKTLRQDELTANVEFKNFLKRTVNLHFLNSGNQAIYQESLPSAYNFIDLDNLKLGRRPFVRSVGIDIQRPMSDVEVIGLGLKDIKQFKEDWKNMDQATKLKYGIPIAQSLMNDFVSPVISIIVGFNVTKVWQTGWSRLFNNLPILEIVDKFRNKQYGAAFKLILSGTVKALLERNGALLRELLIAAGVNLTEAMIKKLTVVVGVFHLIRHGIEVARALYAYATTYITSSFKIDSSSGKMVFTKKQDGARFKAARAH